MKDITTITVTPAAAADAYSRTERGAPATGGATDFGTALQQAIGGAIATGQDADAQAMQGIAGTGNLTEVVTALSRAELVLQSATAIRDRVVQAYQDIMKMPI
ncbi:MAG: flagellar hook-basal body complex protein FliE [Acetobacteraceae bacterium]